MSGNNLSSSKVSQPLSTQVKGLQAQINKLKAQLSVINPTPLPKKYAYAHEREEGLKERYKDYQDNIIADYIFGLYHPDVVFSENLDIKSPSYMPIPTTSFRFKETFTISPNRLGNFVLHWFPNFLGTSTELTRIHRPNENIGIYDYNTYFSNLYVNNSDAVNGNSRVLNDWYAICFKNVQQDFQKYRLTSACMKVRYTGKIIDQSGMMAACASYVQTGRQLMSIPVADDTISSWLLNLKATRNLAEYCDFDTIRQGQWAHTCNVVKDPDGITCTFVPTDPLNQVFVNNGTTIDAIDHTTDWEGSRFTSTWFPTNANLSYFLCGYGLPPNVTCITVEIFYNYEIIVRQEQYPYFNARVANHTLTSNANDISKITQLVTNTGLVNLTQTYEMPNLLTKVRAAFNRGKGFIKDAIPYLVPLMKALA